MNEFATKLIERLQSKNCTENVTLASVIQIANQLTEEYRQKDYCWQTCYRTEHCKECSRLGNGEIDCYENIEEWIGDYKEWTIEVAELIEDFEQMKTDEMINVAV